MRQEERERARDRSIRRILYFIERMFELDIITAENAIPLMFHINGTYSESLASERVFFSSVLNMSITTYQNPISGKSDSTIN